MGEEAFDEKVLAADTGGSMKTQTELDGFERQSDPELDTLVARWLDARRAKKDISQEEKECREFLLKKLLEADEPIYVYVDGERQTVVEAVRSERLTAHAIGGGGDE